MKTNKLAVALIVLDLLARAVCAQAPRSVEWLQFYLHGGKDELSAKVQVGLRDDGTLVGRKLGVDVINDFAHDTRDLPGEPGSVIRGKQ